MIRKNFFVVWSRSAVLTVVGGLCWPDVAEGKRPPPPPPPPVSGWTNAAGGDWTVPTNWDKGTTPNSQDVITTIGSHASASGTFTVTTSGGLNNIQVLELVARNDQTVTLTLSNPLNLTRLLLGGQSVSASNVLNLLTGNNGTGDVTILDTGNVGLSTGIGQNRLNLAGGSMTVTPAQGVTLGTAASGASTTIVTQTAGTFTSVGAVLLGSASNEDAGARTEWTISGGTIDANAQSASSLVVGRGAQRATLNVGGNALVNVAGRLAVSGVPSPESVPATVIDQSMNVNGGAVTAGEILIGQSGIAGANRNSHFSLSGGTVRAVGDGSASNTSGSFVANAGDDTTGAARNISIYFTRGTLEARSFDVDLTGTNRMAVGDGLNGPAVLKFINTASASSAFVDGLHVRSDGILATSPFTHQITSTINDVLIDGGLRIGDADFNAAGVLTSGIGSLTIDGPGLTFTSSAVLTIDIASLVSFDRMNALGANRLLSFGGTVFLNIQDGVTLNEGDSFQVFGSDWAGRTGTFSSITGGGLSWGFDAAIGTFVVVPEPATAALLIGGLAFFTIFCRRPRRSPRPVAGE